MTIDHIALYTNDLERMKTFYETYFNAISNEKYHNPKTGLETYFLSFEGNTRLEIMTRPVLSNKPESLAHLGYIHIALCVGTNADVDALTNTLETDGYTVTSKPRTTGDGYYESCVLDPDGNLIELVAKK